MKIIAPIIMIIILLVELYFMTAGSQHRKKKLLKGWNKTKGTIRSIEKVQDNVGASHKTYMELTIEAESGQTVYARIGTMCIYEVGEEAELMEKDGYHRFLGNDRVNAKGKKELLWGTIPLLVIIIGVAVLSAVF